MRKPKAKSKAKLKLDPKAKARGDRAIKAMHAAGRRLGKTNAKIAAKMKRDATGNTPLARTIAAATLPVDQIKIGKRYRTDFGDLDALARSIDERGGLIHAVAVTPGHHLIAGERRIKAWSRSKFAADPIPVRIIDIDSILAGEWDENAPGIRKDFTYSEAHAISEALLPMLKARAAERMRAGKPASKRAGAPPDKGAAADQAAALVGFDRKTMAKVAEVVAAARDNPEKFGALLEQMDRNGNANGPFKRLTNMRQSEQIAKEPPPLPGQGPYRTGVIDMPWASEPDGASPSETGRGYYNYPTMNTPEMIAFGDKVIPLLHPDGGHFWFWVTNFHLLEGHVARVLGAWSDKLEFIGGGTIKPIGMRTWPKNVMGRGQVFRGQTEHVILCKFGKSPPPLAVILSTRLDGDTGQDSEKPAEFYRDVELATPAPRYFELFARRTMPENWDGFGDQVGTLGEKIREAAADAEALDMPGIAKPKRQRKPKSNAAGSDGSPRSPEPAAAAEPALPGIAPAPAETPAAYLDNPTASLTERKRLDAPIIAATHVEVRLGSHGALYEAFDLISFKTGAGSGYARYPVPQQWAGDLADCNAAIAGLDAAEVETMALGEHPEQAATIAARSPEMAKAQALLGAFARGWWKRDDDQPPADDAEGIPAFLRREASKTSAAA